MNRNFSLQISALTLSILFFYSCTSGNKKVTNNYETPVAVTVAKPGLSENSSISVSGQIVSTQSANISTRVMGFITSVKVNLGDQVKKGQLLVTISNEDLIAKRAQADAMIVEAQAAANNAQKNFDRFTALYNQQSATARELDNVTLQYNAAKSKLEGAKEMRKEVDAMLGYTSLVAPFSGIVTQKTAEAGSMANPGLPLLTIENGSSYEVSALVPENLIDQVKEGMPAEVAIKAVNKILHGVITQVNHSSQFTGGQYIIKVSVPQNQNSGLFAGMYANVKIPVKSVATSASNFNSIFVPASALIYKDQLTGIYTLSSHNTAILRWLRVGKNVDGNVEVLSGLGQDESFILNAEGKLYNGIPVVIKQQI